MYEFPNLPRRNIKPREPNGLDRLAIVPLGIMILLLGVVAALSAV